MLGGTKTQLDAFMTKFDALYKESFPNEGREFMLQSVIGAILYRKASDPGSLMNNWVEWSVNEYVAMKLGPKSEDYLAIHAFLASTAATAANPYDFEHADRYGVAFADEEDFKTFAIQTQNYTYMVLLCRRRVFYRHPDAEGVEMGWAWATHIRVCTTSRYSVDWVRRPFVDLEWLADREKVAPGIGYGDNTVDYFRYKDGRDRGYCISIEPDFDLEGPGQTTYRAESSMARYGMLEGLTYDLASHYDCLDDYKASRARG